jgi:hypothetical protein
MDQTHSLFRVQAILPWRGIEPPRLLARDFESRVSTISPPRLDGLITNCILS